MQEIQNELSQLTNFISTLEEQLEKDKADADLLNKQKHKLEIALQVKQEEARALFEYQHEAIQKEQNERAWVERRYGIIFGFITSLLAGLVIIFIRRRQYSEIDLA